MRLGGAYLANGGDPSTDIFLSPLRASDELFAELPPVFIHGVYMCTCVLFVPTRLVRMQWGM